MQVQRDPRDNEVLNEFHKMSKAISIIHNLEPKGRDIGMWKLLMTISCKTEEQVHGKFRFNWDQSSVEIKVHLKMY